MVGTDTDGSGKHAVQREGGSGVSNGVRPPVLGSMSEAELEAVISQLRTDKNLTLAPAPAQGTPWGATTEQLLRSTSRAPTAAELEEAARQAWFIALEGQVVGPLEFADLRTHWDQGKLGPDSLCWREGFQGWQPVCHAAALSELLAPSPEAPVSARHMIPIEGTDAPGFQLKGAEALRQLRGSLPPPLPLEAALDLPPVLDPEPVTAPAAPALMDAVPVAAAVEDAAGAHPVVRPTQVEVRIRGGLWLALGGGLVGGVLVALVLWGLGPRSGMGAGFHPGSPGAQVHANPSAAVAAMATSAPAVTASQPVTAPVPGLVPDKSAAITGVPAFMLPFPAADVKAAAGGVTGPAVTAPVLPTPLVKSAPVAPEAAPKRATLAPRPAVTVPPLRKLAKVDVAFEQEAPVTETREAPVAADEGLDEALGPDEAFERELAGPPGGAKRAVAKRTVYVPPEPASAEAPATLAQSDIFAVVLANKGDIASCVSSGKPQDAQEGQRVVMRWTITPSGKVTDVVTETARYQGTAIAHCLETKIRAWTFPKHREQGGAVRFPFVF
jgi:hypothetical protein